MNTLESLLQMHKLEKKQQDVLAAKDHEKARVPKVTGPGVKVERPLPAADKS